MSETFDSAGSLAAIVVLILLLAGLVVLAAAHTWLPMAGIAEGLLADEPAPDAAGQPPQPSPIAPGQHLGGADIGRPLPPWRWAAYAASLVALLIGSFAAQRLYAGTEERRRWSYAMYLGAIVLTWGLFTAWLIVREGMLFRRFAG